jgi:stage IV sporulation protein FA
MASEHEWVRQIRKRREQQWRQMNKIRERNLAGNRLGSGSVPWYQASVKQPEETKDRRKPLQSFLNQWIVVMILFLATAAVYSVPSARTAPVKHWISRSLTEEFQFATVLDWYQKYAAGSPALLPAFSGNHQEKKEEQWTAPVAGKIALPFDEKRKGVVLVTPESAKVVAAGEGRVQFTGYKEGLGNTIIIQHANGTETWYGWLEDMKVKEKDWVQKGKEIGTVKKMENQSFFYFAIRKNKAFINPVSVIPFD